MEKTQAANKDGLKGSPIWRSAYGFALKACQIAAALPLGYSGLSDSLQKAAISVPSYIARAYKYDPQAVCATDLRSAKSCIAETETCINLIRDLGFMGWEQFSDLDNQQRELDALLRSLLASFSWTVTEDHPA